MAGKKLSPLRAIRAKCLDCSGGSRKEVKLCVIPDCTLFQYRFGHDPSRKGIGGAGRVENLKRGTESIGK